MIISIEIIGDCFGGIWNEMTSSVYTDDKYIFNFLLFCAGYDQSVLSFLSKFRLSTHLDKTIEECLGEVWKE